MRKFSPVFKDKLFYNKFKYCIGFYLQEISCLRHLDHHDIDVILNMRKHNREKVIAQWASSLINPYERKITQETYDRLHHLLDIVLNEPDCKLVVSYNTGYIYTNDLDFIDKIDNIHYLRNRQYTEAIINRPLDTIRLENSPHNMRSYFRFKQMTDSEAKSLKNFCNLHSKHIRLSPGLVNWINSEYTRPMDHYFIDYSDDSYLTIIKLKFPDLIRKTCTIITE